MLSESSPSENLGVGYVKRLVSVRGPNAFPAELYEAQNLLWENEFDKAVKMLENLRNTSPGGKDNVWIHSALTEVPNSNFQSLSFIDEFSLLVRFLLICDILYWLYL